MSFGDAFAAADGEADRASGLPSAAMPPRGAGPASPPRFHESWSARARRVVLGLGYALRPRRWEVLPAAVLLTAEFLFSEALAARRLEEPDPRGEEGLVGVSENLGPDAVMAAYRRGLFPFCHVGPVKWWSPAERAILRPAELRIEKSLRKTIRQGKLRVTFDTDFVAVMKACAEPRDDKTPLTWITPKIMSAFWQLHQAGHAHSVEVWNGDGHLVGGLYGLACGNIYFGESQFSRVRDASKVGGAVLMRHLAEWGFTLRDGKRMTEHLASLGYRNVPRAQFLRELQDEAWKPGKVGRWSVDESLDVANWRPDGRS
jgi:leucyl/phenylalanyl-tRNA---protein transferase